jgi:putative sigma-54 modulation protein
LRELRRRADLRRRGTAVAAEGGYPNRSSKNKDARRTHAANGRGGRQVRSGVCADQDFREKVQKLPRFFERLTSIEVTVDLKNDLNVVELLVSAEHKHDFVARESNSDVLAGVDLVVDKLEGQLRRYKEKVQDRRRTPSTGEVAGNLAPEGSTEE